MKKICPTCEASEVRKGTLYWPFCSEHCKLIDLGNWLSGRYFVPAESAGQATSAKDETGERKTEH